MRDTLFDAPLELDTATIDRRVRILSSAWLALFGHAPADLASDLDKTAAIFGVGVKPKSIRDRVYAIPPSTDEEDALSGQALLILGGSAVITPEGRILLDVLRELQLTGRTTISSEQRTEALSRAVTLRAGWQHAWLGKQIDGTLSASPLGMALFLLINGSIGIQDALVLPGDTAADRRIGGIVLPLLADFSDTVGGRIPETTGGLRGHWAVSQVSRLLARYVAREADSSDGRIYIRPGQEGHLLTDVTDRLARMADQHKRNEAIQGLVMGYREIRGDLAAIGQAHEDPSRTRRLMARVSEPTGMPGAELWPSHGSPERP